MDAILEGEMPRARLAVDLKLSRRSTMTGSRGGRGPLAEVLLLVTCATIASCDDFDDIVASGEHHLFCGGFRRFISASRAMAAGAGQSRGSGAAPTLLRKLDQGAVA